MSTENTESVDVVTGEVVPLSPVAQSIQRHVIAPAAAQEAARLGLVPGSPDYYLIPRGNQVTGIVSYKGEMELMRRTGRVRDFGHMLVRDNDRFEWRGVQELPLLQEAPEGERGAFKYAVAWAEYRDGTRSSIVRVDRDRIAAAKKASGSARSASSPWVQHEAAMWRKTALRELSLIVGTSVEERRPEAVAAAAEREAQRMERERLDMERMQAENERLRLHGGFSSAEGNPPTLPKERALTNSPS